MLHKILELKGSKALDKTAQTKINGGGFFPICGPTCFLREDCVDANGCPIPNRPGCVNFC